MFAHVFSLKKKKRRKYTISVYCFAGKTLGSSLTVPKLHLEERDTLFWKWEWEGNSITSDSHGSGGGSGAQDWAHRMARKGTSCNVSFPFVIL